MKRFSKIFSGIAAIMLGVGIILIAVGFGRARSDWDKIKGATYGSDQVEREFDNVESIEVNIPFGYLYIGTTGDDTIHFEAVNVDADDLEIKKEGGRLEICADGENDGIVSLFGIPMEAWVRRESNGRIAIQEYRLLLPERYAGQLEVDFGTGKIGVHGVNAKTMEISLNVGEVFMEGCRASYLDVNCDTGECTVEGNFTDISAKTGIGVLDVELSASREAYHGEISCGMGEMEYHMGVDFDEILEYYVGKVMETRGDEYPSEDLEAEITATIDRVLNQNPYDKNKVWWELNINDILRKELGLEGKGRVSWTEEWARQGGIARKKTWQSAMAKGELKAECGVGSVSVRFLGMGPAMAEPDVELLPWDTKNSEFAVPESDTPVPEMDTREPVPEDASVPQTAATESVPEEGKTLPEK